MSELADKVAAMEDVLATSTTFDRFLMDRALSELSGLDLGRIDPAVRRKLDRILSEFNRLAEACPAATDPTLPLPAIVLVEYAAVIQRLRDLANTSSLSR